MSLHFPINVLQENSGVSNPVKLNSAKKNVLRSVKKVPLADVENTVYLKQNIKEDVSAKKQLQLDCPGSSLDLQPSGKLCKSVKKENNSKSAQYILPSVETVLTDEDDCDVDECPGCVENEAFYFCGSDWRSDMRLTKDDIMTLCLDPNPRSRKAPPSPEIDFTEWYEETYGNMPSPPCFSPVEIDYFERPIEFSDDFYKNDFIPPVTFD